MFYVENKEFWKIDHNINNKFIKREVYIKSSKYINKFLFKYKYNIYGR